MIHLGKLLKTQDADLRKKDRDIRRLQDANQHLERENRDMHKFLADYGAPAATRAPLVPHAATSLPSSAAAAMVLIPLSVAPCRLAVGRPILQQDFQPEQCELQPRLQAFDAGAYNGSGQPRVRLGRASRYGGGAAGGDRAQRDCRDGERRGRPTARRLARLRARAAHRDALVLAGRAAVGRRAGTRLRPAGHRCVPSRRARRFLPVRAQGRLPGGRALLALR